MSNYLSVSDLTKYLKLKFDRDPYLERVYLTGQVSNFRRRPNHQYFSLKDEGAVIQATIWGSQFKKIGFDFEEGMKLNVVGRIQLYEPSGSYSIIIEKAEPDGIGALALQFEQLKKQLNEAGYFDDKHKQTLPQFPQKVGVITSPSGAVIRDIITTITRRFPGVAILLFPTKVQGDGAAQEIADHIRKANTCNGIDLLIIGRGGGSIEDLWAFNERIVVEAIYESRLPIISSVGHETDTTLSDFVADKRAATPTAAAELATPVSKSDLLAFIGDRQQRLYKAMLRQLKWKQDRLNQLSTSVIFRQPERLYDAFNQKVDQLTSQLQYDFSSQLTDKKQQERLLHHSLMAFGFQEKVNHYKENLFSLERFLEAAIKNSYNIKKSRFEGAQNALMSLDTKRIVARGYAIVTKHNKPITSINSVNSGDHLMIEMRDGNIKVEVKDAK